MRALPSREFLAHFAAEMQRKREVRWLDWPKLPFSPPKFSNAIDHPPPALVPILGGFVTYETEGSASLQDGTDAIPQVVAKKIVIQLLVIRMGCSIAFCSLDILGRFNGNRGGSKGGRVARPLWLLVP